MITIGLSSHRPEVVALAAAVMERHQAIVLEEPPQPGFSAMLRGEQAIDDYLMECDFEFPLFARQSAQLYRRLHHHGKQILQCEPYLERLREIYELFEQGARPADIAPHSSLGEVYGCERRCSAALLAYYEECLRAPFSRVVELLQCFAREDAVRLRLRDRMRAEAIVPLATRFDTLYIEAGALHLRLVNALRRLLHSGQRISPLYLTAPLVERLSGKRQARGPGELLTLHYLYREGFAGRRADLLAAQTLIHSKVEQKEELPGAAGEFPHTLDEIASSTLVARLGYDDCQRLYQHIKLLTTAGARSAVEGYLKRDSL